MKTIGIILLLLFVLPFASADTGPKPSVAINVSYNGQSVPDYRFAAALLQCNQTPQPPPNQTVLEQLQREGVPEVKLMTLSIFDSSENCTWQPAPLAWGGSCADNQCEFYYFPPQHFKAAFLIPSLNRVFVSNTVDRIQFNSSFTANLNADGTAQIQESIIPFNKVTLILFGISFVLTIFVELGIAFLYLVLKKISKKTLLPVLAGNIISIPIVWFAFPALNPILSLFLGQSAVIAVFFLSELFAVLFEATIIWKLSPALFDFKKAFLLSLGLNIASVIIGGTLLAIL